MDGKIVSWQNNLLPILPTLVILVLLLLVDLIVGDSQLFLLVNQEIVSPILDFTVDYVFIPFFSFLLIIPLAMALLPCLKAEYKASGLISLISGPLSYVIGSLAKPLIMRPRPFDVLPARILNPSNPIFQSPFNPLHCGIWHTSPYSFPSTTTMLAFGLALPIMMEKPRIGFPLVLLSFLVGFSVVYTGFHFMGDVIAGAFLSIAISLCTIRLKTGIISFLKNREIKKSGN